MSRPTCVDEFTDRQSARSPAMYARLRARSGGRCTSMLDGRPLVDVLRHPVGMMLSVGSLGPHCHRGGTPRTPRHRPSGPPGPPLGPPRPPGTPPEGGSWGGAWGGDFSHFWPIFAKNAKNPDAKTAQMSQNPVAILSRLGELLNTPQNAHFCPPGGPPGTPPGGGSRGGVPGGPPGGSPRPPSRTPLAGGSSGGSGGPPVRGVRKKCVRFPRR